MSPSSMKNLDTIPAGRLGLIALESCASLGAKVNDWLVQWRSERREEEDSSLMLSPASVPVRPKASSRNLSVETIFT